MILPRDLKKIVGHNKRRDYLVCKAYLEGKTSEQIGAKFQLSPRRIRGIVYDNASFLNPLVAWSKQYRIMRLQRLANKLEGVTNKTRDEVDILVELRREQEGEKSAVTIDQSTHTHLTLVDLARKLAKEEEDAKRGDGRSASDGQNDEATLSRTGIILAGGLRGEPLGSADRDNGGGAGQSEGNSQVG